MIFLRASLAVFLLVSISAVAQKTTIRLLYDTWGKSLIELFDGNDTVYVNHKEKGGYGTKSSNVDEKKVDIQHLGKMQNLIYQMNNVRKKFQAPEPEYLCGLCTTWYQCEEMVWTYEDNSERVDHRVYTDPKEFKVLNVINKNDMDFRKDAKGIYDNYCKVTQLLKKN